MSNGTTEIATLREFVAYLEENCTSDLVLFRGQREDWPLLPKIGRDDLRLDLRGISLAKAERKMFDHFRQQHIQYADRLDNEREILALAQHHGLPTRLLDWTMNPLAALWFAAALPPKDEKPGVVWVLTPEADEQIEGTSGPSPFDITETVLFSSTSVTRRMLVQAGIFTLHAHSKEGAFIPLESDPRFAPHLTKIVIPAGAFWDLRYHLDRCGVNRAALFPDLDALCAHILWQNSLLDDEVEPTQAYLRAAGAEGAEQ
jgi:hypothetical protein